MPKNSKYSQVPQRHLVGVKPGNLSNTSRKLCLLDSSPWELRVFPSATTKNSKTRQNVICYHYRLPLGSRISTLTRV